MRYCILSDIHANYNALKTCQKFIAGLKVDKTIVLGDFVGYAASPVEVIDDVKKNSYIAIAGNHDLAVVDKVPLSIFNPLAAQSILWTKKILSSSQIKFLLSLGLIYEEANFVCVHSSLYKPQEFYYIFDLNDASLCFRLLRRRICFVGHTHRPIVFVKNKDKIISLVPGEIKIESSSQYIINVGSVGQPRDRDNRSVVCLYDDEEEIVVFYRISYNIKDTAEMVVKKGLPSFFGERLFWGQ